MSLKTFHGSPSLVRVALGAPNQILNAGWNNLRLDTIAANYDLLNEFDIVNNRFVPREAGYYHFHAQISAQLAAGANFYLAAELVLNGLVNICHNQTVIPFALGNDFIHLQGVYYMTPNDFLTVAVLGYALPNTITVFNGLFITFLDVFKVR